jgi:hypothetical protein
MAETDSDIIFDTRVKTGVSSSDIVRSGDTRQEPVSDVPASEDMPPVFRELAAVRLPELARENRARLQMQSPNRLFFYWSAGKNPFQVLRKAFHDSADGYMLVVKLLNLSGGSEDIRAAEPEGSLWFDVEPGTEYRAEVGFYAVNRPYFRLLFSNPVVTPRKSPSPRAATSADWTVTADRFARVLDAAGFSQDAFDVAMAGDDRDASDISTRAALFKFIGHDSANGFDPEDIRYALLAIAAGSSLEEIKYRIGAALYAMLQANFEKVTRDRALSALKDEFGVEAEEFVGDEFGPTVYGSSLVNFPRRLRTKTRRMPKFEPISSHALGR